MTSTNAAPEVSSTAAPPPPAEEQPGHSALIYAAGILLVLVSGAGLMMLALAHRRAEAEEVNIRQAAAAVGPRVRVAEVTLAPGSRTVVLPGEVHAWAQATLYAKVAGYLRSIRVDKGDTVRRGDLIAEIESPEVDESVRSAAADLEFKKVTAGRDHELLKDHFIDPQSVDTADAAMKQAASTLATARAMQQYEIIRAPFAGIITNRYADPGALMPAATSATQSAQPVVDISDLGRLRIQVYLGQDDAALVRVGDPARITMDQRPDVIVQARVSRITNALDVRTRTMLVEIDLDNHKTHIYPGEFIHVQIVLRARPYPVVPAEALIYREDKLYVATIQDRVARFVAVQAGQDDGHTVQIVSGLNGGELVALNAASDIEDGAPVQPVR
jgi:RND family efflux transporter MFP subunit